MPMVWKGPMGPFEPETILLLHVQRHGADKVGLEAKLIGFYPDTCRLEVAWPVGGQEGNFDSWNFHECLREFRRVIEPAGFLVLCQGSRPNVRPSGMSAQAGGLLSYAHNFG